MGRLGYGQHDRRKVAIVGKSHGWYFRDCMIIIIMGVTGSGKTTVGALLAGQLGWKFADADDFHSAANKEKMSHAIALTDAERAPWLKAIHDAMATWETVGQSAVVAC